MRQILRLLGGRYGIALGIVLAVAVAVLIGKAIGGPAHQLPVTAGTAAPVVQTSTEPDDGESDAASPAGPSTSPGAPGPQQVATDFATAWLHHVGVSEQDWFAGIQPWTTANLREQLTGVDPAGVPATKITGTTTVVPHDSGFVEVVVPVDAGTLTLRLLATNGRWLVDGVDWQQS